MSSFVTLTCPSCGGKLRITEDIERFACLHCGSEHLVKRSEGIAFLAPITQVASELALPRLQKDIENLTSQKQAKIAEYQRKVNEIESNLLGGKRGEVAELEWRAEKLRKDIIAPIIVGVILGALLIMGGIHTPPALLRGGIFAEILIIPASLYRGLRLVGANNMIKEKQREIIQIEKEMKKTITNLDQQKQNEIQNIDDTIVRRKEEIDRHMRTLYPPEK